MFQEELKKLHSAEIKQKGLKDRYHSPQNIYKKTSNFQLK